MLLSQELSYNFGFGILRWIDPGTLKNETLWGLAIDIKSFSDIDQKDLIFLIFSES